MIISFLSMNKKMNVSKVTFVFYIILALIILVDIYFVIRTKNTSPVNTNASICKIKYQPTVKKYSTYPNFCINKNKIYKGVIETSFGNIYFNLYPKAAPLAVNNFVFLAKSGFYNNVLFIRVIKNFMIQTGDPTDTGSGGPGYTFKDQINAVSLGIPPILIKAYVKKGYNYDSSVKSISANTPGIIAMANSGPNTNGSQFFITVTKDSQLNGLYTVFGKVTSGMSVVEKIDSIKVDAKNHHRPLQNVNMKKVVILN